MPATESGLRLVHPIDWTPRTQELDRPPLQIERDAFTARMAAILWNLSPHGIMLSDREGKVVAMNYQLCRLLGLSQEAIIGKPLWYSWSDDEKGFDVAKMYSNIPLDFTLGLSSMSFTLSGEFVRTASGKLLLLTMVIPR